MSFKKKAEYPEKSVKAILADVTRNASAKAKKATPKAKSKPRKASFLKRFSAAM